MLTTLLYLLAATLVVGAGIGLVAGESRQELALQLLTMSGFAAAFYGLVLLLWPGA